MALPEIDPHERRLPDITRDMQWSEAIKFRQDSGSNSWMGRDISDWEVELVVKSDYEEDSSNAEISKTFTSHTSAGEGETQISLTESETSNLSSGEKRYTLWVTTIDNGPFPFMRGNVYVQK